MAIPVLPPSAPFTTEQRQYLNGFFAGLFGLEGGANSSNQGAVGVAHNDTNFTDSTAALSGAAPAQNEPSGDESTPWHDPALALDERMELAKDRAKPLQLMAAMAQLDCGQCGYLCDTYAAAIADGSEKSLRKCVPGGKETANKLKELVGA